MKDNKLIAEFIGWFYYTKSDHCNTWAYMDGKTTVFTQCYTDKHLLYNSSWDWLVPIVHRIESINKEILKRYAKTTYTTGESILIRFEKEKNRCFISLDINIIYKAVVEFIKWYNKNK